jgi:cation-transporting ATPase E
VSDPDAYIGFSKYGFLNALLGNVIIGIFQEIKAKKAVDKLKLVDRQENIVIRDGKEQKIYSDDIVLDDIVIFKAGNTITVDGPVVEGVCQMNESMLTGESRTIKKQIGDTVYAGTFIVSGEISVRADKIGRDTSSGIIQNNIKQIKKKKSELMKSLNQIINIIAVVLIPISIGTMISLLKNNEIINLSTLDFANCTPAQVREILRILTTTGSAIIGSIPTGLILLTSVTLATSVLKLSAVKTIVKDMYSVESLSRIDTICFDKTGTLTTGAQTVQDVILCKQYKREFQGTPINDILGCYIHALPADNPTSIAITKYFNSNQKYQIIDKTFFTSDTKHTSVMMSMNGENVKFYLGAPEYLTEDKNLLR